MKNDIIEFDPTLDERQILTGAQLALSVARKPRLVAVRYEPVVEGERWVPYLDLIFHLQTDDGLIIALGLPLRSGRLVWPHSYRVWPRPLLASFTIQAFQQLEGKNLHSRQLFALPGFQEALRVDPAAVHGRWTCPGMENYYTVAQLLQRYRFASSHIMSGTLLEVACGPGYGAGMLLKRNNGLQDYLGMDIDEGAVDFARRCNQDPRGRFLTGDVADLEGEPFDWVLSLETIEHTADPEVFLKQLIRHLKPSGTMIVSLPCERWHGFHCNRNHWSAWNLKRIQNFFEPYFAEINYFVYDLPRFTEYPFEIAKIRPLNIQEDRSRHEVYLMVMRGPRQTKPRSRVLVQRRYARGDALQATPIIHALRQKYPGHQLVVSTDVHEVFINNPDIDLLMATTSGYRPSSDDIVINLDEAYERRPDRHILDAYVEVSGVVLDDMRLRLYPNRYDYDAVKVLLGEKLHSWFEGGVRYLVALHPCGTSDRQWPLEHWCRFLELLREREDVAGIVVGAGSDLKMEEHDRLVSVVSRCDLLTTSACIALSDVLIAPDSALLHVAAAVGTPAIGLYGMANPALRRPYGAFQAAIVAPVDCAGCLHELPPPITIPRCQLGQSFCMHAIRPEVVFKSMNDILAMIPQNTWRRRFSISIQKNISCNFQRKCDSMPIGKEPSKRKPLRSISTSGRINIAIYSVDHPRSACPMLRLLMPIAELHEHVLAKWGVRYSANSFVMDFKLLEWADIVIFQRLAPSCLDASSKRLLEKSGKPIIWETDDDFFAIPSSHPDKITVESLKERLLDGLSIFCAATVSTEALKSVLSRHCKNVFVLPNFIDSRFVDLNSSPKSAEKPLVIGYAGTPTHHEDLELVEELFCKVSEKYGGKIAFCFMGCTTPRLQALPRTRVYPFNGEYIKYMCLLKKCGIDIALAPLVDNQFNRCKSNIKWLEYSACGIVGIYSNLDPYKTCVRHRQTGFLVNGKNVNEWLEALEELIEDSRLRRRISINSMRDVLENYTIQKSASVYFQVWNSVAQMR